MPFNAGETIFAWTHIFKGIDRRLNKRSPEQYLTQLQSQGLAIKAVLYENVPQLCQLCGYSMAELVMSEGWTMHACSAIGFGKILNNQKHEKWLSVLSQSQLDSGGLTQPSSSSAAKASLPTAGV